MNKIIMQKLSRYWFQGWKTSSNTNEQKRSEHPHQDALDSVPQFPKKSIRTASQTSEQALWELLLPDNRLRFQKTHGKTIYSKATTRMLHADAPPSKTFSIPPLLRNQKTKACTKQTTTKLLLIVQLQLASKFTHPPTFVWCNTTTNK